MALDLASNGHAGSKSLKSNCLRASLLMLARRGGLMFHRLTAARSVGGRGRLMFHRTTAARSVGGHTEAVFQKPRSSDVHRTTSGCAISDHTPQGLVDTATMKRCCVH